MMTTIQRYFDLPEVHAGEDARFVIVPVPFEATTSYGEGTARGPAAILTASRYVELYDEELKAEPFTAGIATAQTLDVTGTPEDVMARIEERVGGIAAAGHVPIVLGGEHSITPPAVRGVASAVGDITVVQFDAHADLRDEYEGTKLSHASAMARVRERFPAVQIGIRSLSKPEAEWIERDKLPVFFGHQIARDAGWMERALAAIETPNVYLTIDIDALDPSLVPQTGTPEPGGLSWYDVTKFIKMLAQRKRVVGLDLVELAPQEGHHAADFIAAKLVYKCIGFIASAQ